MSQAAPLGRSGWREWRGWRGSFSRGGVALGAFVSCFLGSSRKESPSHSAVLGVMSWVPAPIHLLPLSLPPTLSFLLLAPRANRDLLLG